MEQCRAWHDIIAFGLADTVGRRRVWHAIIALGQETRSNDVKCGMPSPPWDGTHGQTTSGVACYRRLWAAQTIKRRRAGHAIIAHGRQTRLNDVRRDMPSPSLDSTHGRTTSGVACHIAWEAHTIEIRRAWYDITAFGHHTRLNIVGHDMPSSPLD